MVAFVALFTRLCGFKQKIRSRKTLEKGNQSSTTKREQTSNDFHNKETAGQDNDNNVVNPELPLPPARKAALHGTYSCNNMVLQKTRSTRNKLNMSLTIQMPRASPMAPKCDKEEDKSVRKKSLNAEKSILVRPIILGEKCRVLDEEEGDEDHSQRTEYIVLDL